MSKSPQTDLPPSAETKKILDSLRKTVAKTLERKRRLGQYAVVWQDGKAVAIGDDASLADDDQQG